MWPCHRRSWYHIEHSLTCVARTWHCDAQGLLPIKAHRPAADGRSLKEADFEVAGSPIPVRCESEIFKVSYGCVSVLCSA